MSRLHNISILPDEYGQSVFLDNFQLKGVRNLTLHLQEETKLLVLKLEIIVDSGGTYKFGDKTQKTTEEVNDLPE